MTGFRTRLIGKEKLPYIHKRANTTCQGKIAVCTGL
jgi:hypothetical protein